MLTALEACQYPFQLPTSNNLFGTVNCRVSSFGDDLVDSNLTSLNPSAANILQSQSRFMSPSTSNDSISTLHKDHLFMGNEKEEWEKTQSLALANAKIKSELNVKRKPVPNGILESSLPKSVSKNSMTSMPGGFPSERPITALERVKSKPRGWGIDWLYLAKNTDTIATDATATDKATNAKCMRHSDSAISLEENVGSECAHCASSTIALPKQFVAQGMARPRNVMPSSSISDVAMRSPLSTMRFVIIQNQIMKFSNKIRTADSPDVAIKPDVALVRTTVPSSLDRITPRKLPIAQPLPIAILNEMMVRRPSIPAHSTGMPRPPIATEKLPLPPKHVTPLKRKPAENKLTKQSKSWKDSLPVRGGSFEIGRKPVASSRDITSNRAKDPEPTATPKQKPSAVRPSLKSWKDSLPIRGGSIELERSSATIRDIFPNVTRGSLEFKPPSKPSATPKQAPLTAKKKSENITQTPTKSPNTAYVIKKKSEEMKVPGAFVDYTKPEPLKQRPTSREIKIPGAFIDNISPEPDKSQEEETIRKKPQGVRPLKLRPKANTKAAERAKPLERAKAMKRALEDEPETLYVPAPRGPRDRPFTRKLFGRSNIGAGGNKRDSTQLLDAIQVEYTKVQPLKRLSIGEMSTGMGHLWED